MNFNQLMKQAQVMQKKLDKIKKEYDEKEVEFQSADGAIKGVIDGNLKITSLTIDEELLDKDGKEVLEDLLMITINETVKKVRDEREKAIDAATGGANMEKDTNTMEKMKDEVRRDLSYMTYAPVVFLSALTGQRVDRLFDQINAVANAAAMRITTGMLNSILVLFLLWKTN